MLRYYQAYEHHPFLLTQMEANARLGDGGSGAGLPRHEALTLGFKARVLAYSVLSTQYLVLGMRLSDSLAVHIPKYILYNLFSFFYLTYSQKYIWF